MRASFAGRLGLALMSTMFFAAGAFAAPADAQARREAQHRINISGRQGMLSQRIAKAACLAALNPQNGDAIKEMREARALFASSMQELKTGPDAGDPGLLASADNAARLARTYAAASEEFEANFPAGPYKDKLEKLYELSLPILVSLNDAVEQLEAKHRDSSLIRRGLANALNVSGRQRTLTEKMSKEFCLAASGFKPKETRERLLGTAALFAASHAELKRVLGQMDLDFKVAGPIWAQLAETERQWEPLNKIFVKAGEGSTPSSEDIKTVTAASKTLLLELNRTVELYEAIDTAG